MIPAMIIIIIIITLGLYFLLNTLILVEFPHPYSPQTESQNYSQNTSFTEPGFSYQISGCINLREDVRSFGGEFAQIAIDRNSVNIFHSANHNCCMNATIDKKISGNNLTITEHFYGEVCRCMCDSDINITIMLSHGSYNLNLYKQELDYEPILIASEKIDI